MHFECAAFNLWCIHVHYFVFQSTMEEQYPRQNALECTGLWNHTYLHKRSRADSRPNSHVDATDMGWTGCGRAIRRAHGAPMCHYMSSKSSSDSSPSPNAYTCECKRMRVWMNAFECAWMRKNASASECNVSTECSLCGEAYKCIWMQLV